MIKLPTGEYVSPQYGGTWTLESSSLVHFPTTVIALNRTIRDGTSYASCLTPIPEEWLVERDWEDQFCRDVYQDLCKFPEMQHLRATAITPHVCPVDSIVNTNPTREATEEVTLETLDPCVWKYVLTQDDLATFRLNARSDVIGFCKLRQRRCAFNYYCQVKVKPAMSKRRKSSYMINRTRILLFLLSSVMLTQRAYYRLKRKHVPPSGAAKAYHESQSRIFSTEAPQFVGAGEGTDN